VETGLPDERRVLKACGRAEAVIVVAYGRNAALWWQGVQNHLKRAGNLSVYVLAAEETTALARLASRKMTLNVNIQDASAWVSSETGDTQVQLRKLR
jgi:uncharacterized protein YaeQ